MLTMPTDEQSESDGENSKTGTGLVKWEAAADDWYEEAEAAEAKMRLHRCPEIPSDDAEPPSDEEVERYHAPVVFTVSNVGPRKYIATRMDGAPFEVELPRGTWRVDDLAKKLKDVVKVPTGAIQFVTQVGSPLKATDALPEALASSTPAACTLANTQPSAQCSASVPSSVQRQMPVQNDKRQEQTSTIADGGCRM